MGRVLKGKRTNIQFYIYNYFDHVDSLTPFQRLVAINIVSACFFRGQLLATLQSGIEGGASKRGVRISLKAISGGLQSAGGWGWGWKNL